MSPSQDMSGIESESHAAPVSLPIALFPLFALFSLTFFFFRLTQTYVSQADLEKHDGVSEGKTSCLLVLLTRRSQPTSHTFLFLRRLLLSVLPPPVFPLPPLAY